MNNLVIGSSGFIGKSLCEYLRNKNEIVTEFDIVRNKNEDAREVVFSLEKFDRIYFLAWEVGGAKYLYAENAQFEQLDNNLQILINLMPQLKLSNKPFLFISSQLAEDVDTVYGVTKRLGEVWTKLLPNGFFIRQWNVYGPIEGISMRSHVISDFILQAITTGEIKMLTTGDEFRQFIHIDDVCSAYYTVIDKKIKGTFDVTSFEWIKVIDVAKIISEITGAKVIPGKIIGSTPNTPIKGKIPDWKPTISMYDGLNEMVEKIEKFKLLEIDI